MSTKPRAIGLFDGIGGGLLAAKRAGCEIVASCEINRFCQEILKAKFPEAKHYGDIYKADFSPFYGNIDVLLAGFPCQPYSTAGLRKGSLDDRALWPVTCRVIDAVRPRVAVLENVAGLLTILQPDSVSEVEEEALPLFRDGDHNGFTHTTRRVRRRVLADILGDLDAIGYEVPKTTDGTPVVLCVPAAAVGACHRRDRVGIVAYDNRPRQQQPQGADQEERGRAGNCSEADAYAESANSSRLRIEEASESAQPGISDRIGAVAYSCHAGLQIPELGGSSVKGAGASRSVAELPQDANPLEVASLLCSVDDGVPAGLDGSASRSAWRSESLKGYGNAWHVGLWEVIVRAAIEALDYRDERRLAA